MQDKKTTTLYFSERFSIALKKKGLKQLEFSEITGIPKTSISRYICGRHLPSVTELLNISQALDVSMDWLCGKEKYKNVYFDEVVPKSTSKAAESNEPYLDNSTYWKERALLAEERVLQFENTMNSLLGNTKQNSTSQKTG